jgi:hypothetical protein
MRVRVPVFILAFSALISGVIGCSRQSPKPSPVPLFIFDERPFQMDCSDRPHPLPYFGSSTQAPFARTRLETLNLPLEEVPALTIAEPMNWVEIVGANQDHWTAQYCATGEGKTVDEANNNLQRVYSMQRVGGLLTLNDTDPQGQRTKQGGLLLTAPAGAPVTVHSEGAVQVHDMAGPVRVSAPWGRTTILNTTGRVDAFAYIVDYAGSQGAVSLNASEDVEIKFTATKFVGHLRANAQRRVQALFPSGFQSPIRIVVNSPKDFICRADFCSKFKMDRIYSSYRFTYGDVENAAGPISLQSAKAEVVLDTTQ